MIEALITQLVQEAPARDPAVVEALLAALAAITAPPAAAALAQSIAAILPRVGTGVDPGIALPALAMACATLTAGLAGTLTARELDAARYEIDTLTPIPSAPPIAPPPDVPLTRLRRVLPGASEEGLERGSGGAPTPERTPVREDGGGDR